jgi:hypothetical protein
MNVNASVTLNNTVTPYILNPTHITTTFSFPSFSWQYVVSCLEKVQVLSSPTSILPYLHSLSILDAIAVSICLLHCHQNSLLNKRLQFPMH